MMPASAAARAPQGYAARVGVIVTQGLAQLIRPASHSRRADAGRTLARRTLFLAIAAAIGIVALMFLFDAREITWMPPRGAAGLWPLKILTDLGKSNYVLTALFALLVVVVLVAAKLRGVDHATMIGFGTRVQYMFVAVLVPVLIGELLKGIVGRGRPFVGGEPYAFHFSHFAWTEAYASFPSGHATTSCALAFAAVTLWPSLRKIMVAYVIVIIGTRLVLLAHHPSDVLGGALNGLLGAMAVRYWFAARRLAFFIRDDGCIKSIHGPTPRQLAHVLRRAIAA